MAAEGQVFSIRVIEGPAELRGKLVPSGGLVGRSLPYPGGKWGGEQRSKTTYYAGNPVASQQILGPTEKPLALSGKWKDRFLGNGVAKALAVAFDQLRQSGALLEVSWGDTDVVSVDSIAAAAPIVRRGILKRFEFKPDRSIEDIDWEMEFEWRGRDDAAAPVTLSLGGSSTFRGLDDTIDEVGNAAAAVKANLAGPLTQVLGASQAVQDAIDDNLNQVFNSVQQLAVCSEAIAQQSQVPYDLANRVVGSARLAANSLANLLDIYDQVQFHAMDVRDNALTLLSVVDDVLTLKATLRAARERANDAADQMESNIVPDVLVEVQVPAGTDLRDLARKYYGNADLWWLIADYNDLGDSGVPALPSGPSDQARVTIQIPRRGGPTWNALVGTSTAVGA